MNTTAKMFKDRLINKYLSKFSKDNINDFDVHIPVAGIHMVYNSMAAAAVGAEFGLTSK